MTDDSFEESRYKQVGSIETRPAGWIVRIFVPERLLHSQQGVSLTNRQGMVERSFLKLYRFSDYPVPAHLKGVRRFIGRTVQAVSDAPMCKYSETGGDTTLSSGEFRPRQTRQLPRAVDLKGRLLSCQSY